MKRRLLCAVLVAVLVTGAGALHAAGFTYHGTLQDSGKPAEGNYDIELTLYSAASGGSVVGGPLTMLNVPVHSGSFSTQADFGPLAKSFDKAWLGVKVRTASDGDFLALDQREQITPEATDSVCPGAWTLAGNAGNPSGSYVGTADATNFILATDATTAATTLLIPGKSVPTWLGGRSNQFFSAANGEGGFIGGGGGTSINDPNSNVVGAFSVVGGGKANKATGLTSSVLGGNTNVASGREAVVVGGDGNTASGSGAFIAAGSGNSAGGDNSFAAGSNAIIRNSTQAQNSANCIPSLNCGDYSTFIWADGVQTTFESTGPNQFLIRASNGVAINGTPNSANDELSVYGNGNGGNNVDVDLFPYGSSLGFSLAVTGSSETTPAFFIEETDGNTIFNQVLSLDAVGDLTIAGSTATKAGTSQWTTTSDRRIKQDITPIEDALDTVLRLRPVSFHYTPEYRAMVGSLADKAYQGFIAQEFAEVFPEAVISTEKQVPGAAAGDESILALDPNPAFITTIAAVQELAEHDQNSTQEIIQLRQENADLRSKLDDVLTRLSKLENNQGE